MAIRDSTRIVARVVALALLGAATWGGSVGRMRPARPVMPRAEGRVALPDLVIGRGDIAVVEAAPGSTALRIEARIRNDGRRAAHRVMLAATDRIPFPDGKPEPSAGSFPVVDEIRPGQARSVTGTYDFHRRLGERDIYVWIDPENRIPEGFHMGQVALTDRDCSRVSFSTVGVQPGDAIQIVENRSYTAQFHAAGPTWAAQRAIATAAPTFVRFEVYRADGVAVAFSNPIYFVRTPPPGGIPAARLAVPLAPAREAE